MTDVATNGNAAGTKVEFVSRQDPALRSGAYTITVAQALSAQGQTFSAVRRFDVQGPRFVLRPTDIRAVFPGDGSLGDHSAALPHVVLVRGTLPWERAADRGGSSLPWLALLLFDDAEKPAPTVVTFGTLASAGVRFPAIVAESQDRPDDPITVIDVRWALLAQLLPTAAELPWLAHVRRPLDAAGHRVDDGAAVVIGNRLPISGGTATVHLVSLEGRYDGGAFDAQGAGPDDRVRLVSLTSWSFTCTDPSRDFAGLLRDVGRDPATLRLPRSADPTTESYLALGSAALPHALRRGGTTVSWYHGPLSPSGSVDELEDPVRAADELVRYDPATGLFDVSYAAAWELGRMLALRSTAFAASLYKWKRASVQWLRAQEQRILHPHITVTLPPAAPMPPPDVVAWFDDLRVLRGVPFDYLVPDERMLPVESLRFFRVDHLWVDCLLDGAFSVGRVSDAEADREAQFAADPTTADAEAMSGFLLRSDVVANWPGLLADADDDGRPLERVRLDRLSANVLVGIFRGEIGRVAFGLAPEGLHFGLDRDPPAGPGQTSTYHKTLRDADGDEQDDLRVAPVPFRVPAATGPAGRVLDVSALTRAIAQALGVVAMTSAQFAVQMVEGAPKVAFTRAVGSGPPAV